jgi:farnesyl-diphosphate farnesyltransferase
VADLHHLLERTSRTFALNIPLLPEPTRREVTLAYLLFRIADTFEDSVLWPREERMKALDRFAALLHDPRRAHARELAEWWGRTPPLDHEGYLELLAETPAVIEAFRGLSPGARVAIRDHVVRTARGMREYVARADERGELNLVGLQELRDYCYVVAGIVGEMLTVLFLLGRPALAPVGERLRRWAPEFGEGLQLTNILKDSAVDAHEGRRFLPAEVDRSRVFELARRDLEQAAEYTRTLQSAGAERGLVAFNALPVALARATLDRVQNAGPGTKISREEVWRLVGEVESALDQGRPVLSGPAAG